MTDLSNNQPSTRTVIAAVSLNIGLLLIMVGTVMPLVHVGVLTARWVYAVGAVLSIIGRFAAPAPSSGLSFRLRRLYRLETWSTILFAVAVFFMFYPSAGVTDWIAFTLAGGFIQAYTSIMIPRALKKE